MHYIRILRVLWVRNRLRYGGREVVKERSSLWLCFYFWLVVCDLPTNCSGYLFLKFKKFFWYVIFFLGVHSSLRSHHPNPSFSRRLAAAPLVVSVFPSYPISSRVLNQCNSASAPKTDLSLSLLGPRTPQQKLHRLGECVIPHNIKLLVTQLARKRSIFSTIGFFDHLALQLVWTVARGIRGTFDLEKYLPTLRLWRSAPVPRPNGHSLRTPSARMWNSIVLSRFDDVTVWRFPSFFLRVYRQFNLITFLSHWYGRL